jgi:hypothetical protein
MLQRHTAAFFPDYTTYTIGILPEPVKGGTVCLDIELAENVH